MKLISSSTARRRTSNAAFRSLGGPQMPSPVRRIAPKPRRCTEISPPSETSPAKLAESSFLFMIDLQNPSVHLSHADTHGSSRSNAIPCNPEHSTRLLAQRITPPGGFAGLGEP